jgi:hypothetical protein
MMKKIRANKGEWSEFYAFLKILEQKKLPAADKNLESKNKFFIFYEIFREEDGLEKIYNITDSSSDILVTDKNGNILKKFSGESLKSKTIKIFEKIKKGKESFEIEEAELLMNELLCKKVKAGNNKKSDIVATIKDIISETAPKLGFSVKSMIGGSSTLFNASQGSNFIFEVTGFKGDVDKINSIQTKSKIRDRLMQIVSNHGKLAFASVANSTFDSNLKNIDTAFPKFMAYMLIDFFLNKRRSVKELVAELANNEELKKEFGLSLTSYESKVKRFLDAVALGMVVNTEWSGLTQAHGGYIIVKENGEVVCYHLYNRDEFSSYLFENTKFDTPSSSRHKSGLLYENDGKMYFNLNLQIRFMK